MRAASEGVDKKNPHCNIFYIAVSIFQVSNATLHIHTSELFYLCLSIEALFLLTVKEILLVHFVITNFRVAHKMLCRPWRQFFFRFVKIRFRILDIQITIVFLINSPID
jgi:hypothetical protein